jgi:hypothetical protein
MQQFMNPIKWPEINGINFSLRLTITLQHTKCCVNTLWSGLSFNPTKFSSFSSLRVKSTCCWFLKIAANISDAQFSPQKAAKKSKNAYTFSHIHSHSLTHSITLSHSLTFTHFHSHSLTFTHFHPLSLSLSHIHSHSLTFSHSLDHSYISLSILCLGILYLWYEWRLCDCVCES